jgi:hypothetical protein
MKMRNKTTKNFRSIDSVLTELKDHETLEPVQVQGIAKATKLLEALSRSLQSSNKRKSRELLNEISKVLVKAFVKEDV